MADKQGEHRREYKRQYYLKNRERIRDKQNKKYYENRETRRNYYMSRRVLDRRKELRQNDPRNSLLAGAKVRAKRRGLSFNIELCDLDIPEKCPILGIELRVGEGKVSNCSPSIDRLDPNKGYVKGNIRIISWKANKLKSDLTYEQVLSLKEYIEACIIDPVTGQPTCS